MLGFPLTFAFQTSADTRRIVISGPMSLLRDSAKKKILKDSAELANPEAARGLLLETSEVDRSDPGEPLKQFAIIHVLRWADPGQDNKQAVGSQNWYVFRDERLEKWSHEDFTSRDRIFGQKKITFLYIHLNRRDTEGYEPVYDIRIKQKQAANLLNLFSAAALFTPLVSEKGPPDTPDHPTDFWKGGTLEINYVPSDITISPKVAGAEQIAAKTFDNEGRARWDISIGVPVRKIGSTEFDADTSVVRARTVDKQNIFALLNLFPFARDLKGSNLSWTPSVVTGVGVASQPLHKVFLGLGWGPHFASFYAGALFVKQPSTQALKEGQAATPGQLQQDLKASFSPQFAFGINLGVRAAKEKLSGGK